MGTLVALLSSPSTAPAVLTCRTSSHSHRDKLSPIMSDRLSQISSHISSGNYPKGLLNGEVAIITGAAQGIGRSAALQFAKEGAKVVVSDLDEKKAQAVVDEIKKAGGDAIAVGGDVTNPQFPKDLVSKTVQKYGKINHIINNAGFTYDKMIHTMDDETFKLILDCHNLAPFRIIREAAPYFRIKEESKRENRSITNVSSTSGLHGNVGQVNYAVAKAGVVGLSKTIAKEWGSFGVRCNTVAYGYILTRLTQAKAASRACLTFPSAELATLTRRQQRCSSSPPL